jgi:peptidoglycan-associated lipoprotein
MSTTKKIGCMIGFLGLVVAVGCHHEVAKNQPNVPPAAPPASPSAAITANPAYIEKGQATTLSWQTANANDINIQNLGMVPATGSRTIYPTDSTTYELVAKGPGGTGSASARVTVNTPYASRSSESRMTDEQLFAATVQDVFFDYNRYDVRTDEMPRLQKDAEFLKEHPGFRVVIEGHCDERGSEEYNLALGDKRATAVKKALLDLGVSQASLQTVSYGKEKPFCNADNEQCWSQNRRDHFSEKQ